MIKTLLAALALTTALSFSAAEAMAKPVTFKTAIKDYGGNNTYLAMYVTDQSGSYVGTLWLAGSRTRYFEHLAGWYRATGGDTSQLNGITGASIGSGASREGPRCGCPHLGCGVYVDVGPRRVGRRRYYRTGGGCFPTHFQHSLTVL